MRKALYLFSYDISDNKKRTAVHKHLSAEAFAVQKSVFVMFDYLNNVKRAVEFVNGCMEDEDRLLVLTIDNAHYCKVHTPYNPNITVFHENSLLQKIINGEATESIAA